MVDYVVTQEFIRIEAIGMHGARHSDPADPAFLRVYVTAAEDINDVYEDIIAGPGTTDALWRLRTGKWALRLTPGYYSEGRSYTVHWRFQMTPGNDNVTRTTFTWKPIAEEPREETGCIVYGRLVDIAGAPMADARLIVERYKDSLTLTHRLGLFDLYTDSFGYWWVELERGGIYRLVFGEVAKTIQVPEQRRVSLSEIGELQLEAPGARLDKFGYPIPT